MVLYSHVATVCVTYVSQPSQDPTPHVLRVDRCLSSCSGCIPKAEYTPKADPPPSSRESKKYATREGDNPWMVVKEPPGR
jgi:hypothetical protein